MDISHQPCPCGKSSDGFSDQGNGWGKCFVCSKNFKLDKEIENNNKAAPPEEKKLRELTPLTKIYHPFPLRGYGAKATERFKIDVNQDPDSPILARYPLFRDGVHVANKVRGKDKKFWFEGDPREVNQLMGEQAFPKGGRYITIVEGQDDMAAVYEMTGSQYPCVSVSSSSSAGADCKTSFEYLNSFEHIIVCMDGDEPGQKAARDICQLPFPLGKVQVLKLREHKDANDYLRAKKHASFIKEWWAAPVYKPDGLKLGSELWDDIVNRPNHFQVNYPFMGLNRMTYGVRLSEMVTVTAETGRGKTSLLKEIEYALLMDPEIKEKGYGVGFLHLEEPNGDTVLGLMSIHNSQPYHLPDCPRPEADLRVAYDSVVNNNRVVIWDHFGSNTVDAVLDKIRHMHALGCRYIVLDHLSIVVSDQQGDERKQLDEISTKIKTLCMTLNIAVICVIHQNRQGQIRGTAGVEQLSNIVMKLERLVTDPNEWRRNVLKITIEKNRFCGRCGPCCWLWYDETTGRLVELTQDQIELYEEGGHVPNGMEPF